MPLNIKNISMKALYDKGDRDYYIFFEKGEVPELLAGRSLHCYLYVRSSIGPRYIQFERNDFYVSVLENQIDLYKKNEELTDQKVLLGYSDVLVVYGDYDKKEPCILYLSKEFIKIGLSLELLNRCGKNEQRYGGGCKVHFYSDGINHLNTNQMKLVFDMEEIAWKRDYGSDGMS